MSTSVITLKKSISLGCIFHFLVAIKDYLAVCIILEWLPSHTPYLIHDNTITPHVTSSGVLLVVKSLSQLLHGLSDVGLLQLHTSGAVHLTGIIPPCET